MDRSYTQYFASSAMLDIADVLASWQNKGSIEGVLIFLQEAESASVPALQELCNGLNLPVVGAISPELIIDGRFVNHGILLFGIQHAFRYTLFENVSIQVDDIPLMMDETGRMINDAVVDAATVGKPSLYLLCDALIPRLASFLDMLYTRFGGRVHYMGVNAGSETFTPVPCLFDHQRFVQGGILAMVLPEHEGAVMDHGYEYGQADHMTMATATVGNRIASIDWRPAFEVYAEMAMKEYGVEVTRENFYSMAVHFPLGIIRAEDEVLVRIPVILEDDGSVRCVGEVPENSLLTLLHAPDERDKKTIIKIDQRYNYPRDDTVLLFYCAGRKMHLADQAEKELAELVDELSPAIVVGALSLGEIGSFRAGDYPYVS